MHQLDPVPIVHNVASSYKADEFGKLMPKHTARILLNQLVLTQLSRLNWEDFPNNDHLGNFTVSVYCRIVGSTSFDQVADNQPKSLSLHWRPSGFKQDAKHVKEVLEIKPSIRIVGTVGD